MLGFRVRHESFLKLPRMIKRASQDNITTNFTLISINDSKDDYEISINYQQLQELEKILPKHFNSTSVYGNMSEVNEFLEKSLETKVLTSSIEKGIFSFFHQQTKTLFLVYIIPDGELPTDSPIFKQSRLNFIVRLLIDLSDTIIPVIPDPDLHWFYEEEGKLNPFDKENIINSYREGKVETFSISQQLSKGFKFRIMPHKFSIICEVNEKVTKLKRDSTFDNNRDAFFERTLEISDVLGITSLLNKNLGKVLPLDNIKLLDSIRELMIEYLNKKERLINEFVPKILIILFLESDNIENYQKINSFLVESFKKDMKGDQAALFKVIYSGTEFKYNKFRDNLKSNRNSIKETLNDYSELLNIALRDYKSRFTGLTAPINLSKEFIFNFCSTEIVTRKKSFIISPLIFSKSLEFKFQDMEISQVVAVKSDCVLILLSNKISLTVLIELHQSYLKNELRYDFNDPEVKIASFSKYESCFIYENSSNSKIITCRALGGDFKTIKSTFNVQDVDPIKTFYYLETLKSLLILTKTGKLYSTNLENSSVTCLTESSEDLNPLNGTFFIDLAVSSDEKFNFLLSNSKIQIFSRSFKQVFAINLKRPVLRFNCINIKSSYYLILEKENKLKTLQLSLPRTKEDIERLIKMIDENKVRGNPIVDTIQHSLNLYGDIDKFTDFLNLKRKFYYYSSKGPNRKVEKYISNLSNIFRSFEIAGFKFKTSAKEKGSIEKSDFIKSVHRKVPAHIAKFFNGLLLPLNNSIDTLRQLYDTIDSERLFEFLFDYTKFDYMENILKETNQPFVFSALNQDNLLNYIVGTRSRRRFNKESHGIWISNGQVLKNPVVLLECEGFFDESQTDQDLIKSLLMMWSVSDTVLIFIEKDLTVLNSVLNLMKFMKSKLKGSKLFNSLLYIITTEGFEHSHLSNFISSVECVQNDLGVTFFREIQVFCISSPDNRKKFLKSISKLQISLIEHSKKKWDLGYDLSIMIKVILCQLFTDDAQSVDERFNFFKLLELRKQANKFLSDYKINEPSLDDENCLIEIKFKGINLKFEISLNDLINFRNKPSDNINSSKISLELSKVKTQFYNKVVELLKIQIQDFVDKRKEAFTNHFKSKIEQMNKINKKYEIVKVQNIVNSKPGNLQLCMNNCKFCGLYCIECKGIEHDCNCETSHMCEMSCFYCKKSRKCSLYIGHPGKHLCKEKPHSCKSKCSHCEGRCCLKKKHKSIHKCTTVHRCKEKCKASACDLTCKEEVDCIHENHRCFLKKCVSLCALNPSHECSSLNHFHEFEMRPGEVHLCGLEHICPNKCEGRGICSIEIVKSIKTFTNALCSISYIYADLKEIRGNCTNIIPRDNRYHLEELHSCDKDSHFCTIRCPDCNCFCDREFNHEGFHCSSSHRNKDESIYISTEKIFMDEVLDLQNNKMLGIFTPGDSPSPLNCEQFCLLKKQGHTHPVPCPGEPNCLGKINPSKAKHFDSLVQIGSGRILVDLLECSFYWEKHDWVPPVQMVDKEKQKDFGKCNFSCGSKAHKAEGKTEFCQDALFHTSSGDYRDHSFLCTHEDFIFNDIVFLVDSTGSMETYFEKVKNVIEILIKKWGVSTSRFAAIGFTDHHPDNGNLPDIIEVFPTSGNLDEGDPYSVGQYIGQLKAGGGGGNGGEALIDALAQVNKLIFREKCNHMVVVITDDSPHGSEFGSLTAYPEGCPCGINWRDELRKMKEMNTQLLFVRLNSNIDLAVQKFKEVYGYDIKVLDLNTIEHFEIQLSDAVAESMLQLSAMSKKYI